MVITIIIFIIIKQTSWGLTSSSDHTINGGSMYLESHPSFLLRRCRLNPTFTNCLRQRDYISGSVGLLVCLSFCLSVCLLATLLKRFWIDCSDILFSGPGVKRNKWLDVGSELDYDPTMAEVCTLRVLGIWWLSVDIWWKRSIIGWLSEWIQRLIFSI